MYRIIYLFILVGFFSNLLFAQAPQISWMKSYERSPSWMWGDETGYSVQKTFDDGFIIAGEARISNWYTRSLIIKTDANGDTLWTRIHGGELWCGARSIKQMPDRGFIVNGFIRNSVYGYVFLFRLDTVGNAPWWQMIKDVPNNSKWNGANAVEITPDSGFIMTGWMNYGNYTDNDQLLLSKTDSLGNLVWIKNYGTNTYQVHDSGIDIKRISSGGYIVVGNTYSYGAGGSDIYMLNIDENGDTLWTRTYGGSANESARTVWETKDRGFIILGNTRSFGPGIPNNNAYVIRTDSLGDTL